MNKLTGGRGGVLINVASMAGKQNDVFASKQTISCMVVTSFEIMNSLNYQDYFDF